ncbi:hypothetical protein FDP41_007295 [Naegleria fowleri]|uniref:Uncharacterized protein n=1 Tax=Naegleria fowleri TaxID=5763 RepID=A0A6A5BIN4_NAEFO|nr:uncharacterized protein FDP41_007295 [Naegleria fowleri]KAF0973908.1 hypothetical protein FDP41_007295 [Naegleria fowleri]
MATKTKKRSNTTVSSSSSSNNKKVKQVMEPTNKNVQTKLSDSWLLSSSSSSTMNEQHSTQQQVRGNLNQGSLMTHSTPSLYAASGPSNALQKKQRHDEHKHVIEIVDSSSDEPSSSDVEIVNSAVSRSFTVTSSSIRSSSSVISSSKDDSNVASSNANSNATTSSSTTTKRGVALGFNGTFYGDRFLPDCPYKQRSSQN